MVYFEDGTEDGAGSRTSIIAPTGEQYDVTHLLAHARREALEEAALVCEAFDTHPWDNLGEYAACAAAIRALKEK